MAANCLVQSYCCRSCLTDLNLHYEIKEICLALLFYLCYRCLQKKRSYSNQQLQKQLLLVTAANKKERFLQKPLSHFHHGRLDTITMDVLLLLFGCGYCCCCLCVITVVDQWICCYVVAVAVDVVVIVVITIVLLLLACYVALLTA